MEIVKRCCETFKQRNENRNMLIIGYMPPSGGARQSCWNIVLPYTSDKGSQLNWYLKILIISITPNKPKSKHFGSAKYKAFWAKWGKAALGQAKLAHTAGAYPGFHNMKLLGVSLLPLDGITGYPRHFVAGTHLYSWVERGTVRVKCLAQEHNTVTPASAWPGLLDSETNAPTIRPPRQSRAY